MKGWNLFIELSSTKKNKKQNKIDNRIGKIYLVGLLI